MDVISVGITSLRCPALKHTREFTLGINLFPVARVESVLLLQAAEISRAFEIYIIIVRFTVEERHQHSMTIQYSLCISIVIKMVKPL